MQETAESDGVELYEIDDIGEFNQLFPTIGQSVAIFADPKKCAKGLQSNKKAIQKLHSKVILLSTKPIPKKTLEKFDKVGLTECIIEPVVPKTLLYKVKLHLRSIISKEEQEEQTKSFSKSDDKNEKEEQDLTTRKFSSQSDKKNDEDSLSYQQNKLKTNDSSTDDDASSSYYDEEIETHWKGKNASLDESAWSDPEEKKKGKYQEDSLDGYYKGKVKKHHLEFEEDDEHTASKENTEYLEDEINNLKKDLLLEVEEDLTKAKNDPTLAEEEAEKDQKKKSLAISLESVDKAPVKKVDQIDSYLKGQSSFQDGNDDLNDAAESMREHLKNDPMTGQLSAPLTDEEEYTRAKGARPLSLIQDEEENEKSTTDHSQGLSDKMIHDGQVIHDKEADDLTGNKKRKAEQIEKYIKGSLSHRSPLDDDDEMIDNEEDLIIDPIEMEDEVKRSSIELQVADEIDLADDAPQAQHDELSTPFLPPRLDVEKEEKDARSSGYSENNRSGVHSNSARTDQIDDEQTSRTQYREGDLNDKYSHQSDDPINKSVDEGHLSGEGLQDKENKKKAQLADNRADKIQKYYKGRGNSHQQQGWGNLHQQDHDLLADFEKNPTPQNTEQQEQWENTADELQYGTDDQKKNSGEFVQNEKEKGNSGELIYNETSLGEQTIDYKKLKEQFDAIPYGLKDKGNKYGNYDPTKKEAGYQFESGDAKKNQVPDIASGSNQSSYDPFLKDVPPDILAQRLEERAQLEKEQEDEDASDTIYEPRPQGLDEVIKISGLYLSKQENFRQRLELVAHKALEKFGGYISFYLKKPDSQYYDEVFVSYFDLANVIIDESKIQSWNSLKEIKFPFWLQMTLPTWSDNTFQDQDCEFFYPFTENQVKLGFAVVHFTEGFNAENSPHLEVFLDALRGFFIEQHQQEIHSGQKPMPKKDEVNSSKGLFGRFFKDKAS